jgi:hypothetical protein
MAACHQTFTDLGLEKQELLFPYRYAIFEDVPYLMVIFV